MQAARLCVAGEPGKALATRARRSWLASNINTDNFYYQPAATVVVPNQSLTETLTSADLNTGATSGGS